MLNTEIKYKLSTDYKKLLQLLKDGNLIVGFIALDIDGKVDNDYSKLVQMAYSKKYRYFDLGFTFFEKDFDKLDFGKLCLKYNVRFIDLNF
jgi:hypothetical protein